MPPSTVRTDHDGEIAVVTLDRPDVLNTMNLTLLDQLRQALLAVEQSDARALVLTGAGDTFCAGADLNYVRGAVADGVVAGLQPLVQALHAMIRQMRSMSVPVVAAVEGSAVGAAFALALSADLRVVARGARFVPGYLRIGASPDGGMSWLLTRALGGARAASLLLRNRPLTGEDAYQLGIADELTDDGSALDRARELAVEVAGASPMALRHLRELTAMATVHPLDQHLDLEEERLMEIWRGPDFAEGVGAFLEKRRPNFAHR
jgi:2-(1,2-epoxy-1,2-dihydrophenyl)acetyl-CoA isomerase